MDWLHDLFYEHTAVQAVVVIAVIIAIGLGLAKIHIKGVSLGVTWVFFAGIFAGHIGLSIDHSMLVYAENFGLVLFVYELGLKVGPGFFSSFMQGGVKLNLLGLGTVLSGTALAIGLSYWFGISMSDMAGILSGATTNTPSLGAAQQALQQLGISANGAALSCAVTYPLGVAGVILAIIFLRHTVVRPADLVDHTPADEDNTFIATYIVRNPAACNHTLRELAAYTPTQFVVSRLWRNGNVSVPGPDTVVEADDRLMVITTPERHESLTLLFGEDEQRDWNKNDIDWNKIDHDIVSRHVLVTKPALNGRKLGTLKLRNMYGVNVTRVMRSGVKLLATPGLVLQLGDRLTVVGNRNKVEEVGKLMGNRETKLKDPNLAVIFVGLVLGLLLGSVPVHVPGMTAPIKLGLAGGPIVVGILMGRFGPNLRMVTYTTRSANLMLRGIGLSLYLACLGLDSGAHFVETITEGDGFLWLAAGFLITLLPVLLMGLVSLRAAHLGFGQTCGMLCGAMANPMALNYANDTLAGDSPSVSYATVYPVAMFSRVVIAQLLVMCF